MTDVVKDLFRQQAEAYGLPETIISETEKQIIEFNDKRFKEKGHRFNTHFVTSNAQNLIHAIANELEKNGKSTKDIKWVGTADGKHAKTWDKFKEDYQNEIEINNMSAKIKMQASTPRELYCYLVWPTENKSKAMLYANIVVKGKQDPWSPVWWLKLRTIDGEIAGLEYIVEPIVNSEIFTETWSPICYGTMAQDL